MHQLSRQLHPSVLKDLGLAAAVRSFCREFSEKQGIPIEFNHHHVPSSVPSDVALCLYRVVQESLRNVARHCEARKARVDLAADGEEIHLSISDPGVGFDLASARNAKGLGLISMEERLRLVGGELSVDSAVASGTRIEARVPLRASPAAEIVHSMSDPGLPPGGNPP